jgi:hypothetical protein
MKPSWLKRGRGRYPTLALELENLVIEESGGLVVD